jgi:formate hydrogenlyase subunit 3/multisubunit Na+/H+ antiporter MnhD subunit
MTGPPSILPQLFIAAVVGLPLLSAAALAVRPWRRFLCRSVPWAALPALAAAGLMPQGDSIAFRWLFLEAKFGLDPTGRMFLFSAAALWLIAGVFGTGYLAGDRRPARFFFFWALAMSGNLGLILSQDMVGFYVFSALMSFAFYGLIVHTGSPDGVQAGRVYLALVVAGEIFLFDGMAMLAVSAGSLDFVNLRHHVHTNTTILLILAAFGIKAAALPLHVWLPPAQSAAPIPACAVLSGAVINAGVLGWMRFIPADSAAALSWGAWWAALGIAAVFYGLAVGFTQSNPKSILAYSSISQMGLIFAGFGMWLWNPALAAGSLPAVTLYAMHHGVAGGALLLGVGILPSIEAENRASGIAWAGFLLAAFSLAAAPVTSGAVVQAALENSLGLIPQAWQTAMSVLLPLASAGTTLLMGRLAYVMAGHRAAHGNPTRGMWISWFAMLLLAAVPLFVLPKAGDAENAVLKKLGGALWPLAAGGALTALGWAAARKRLPLSLPRMPSGDIIVIYSAVIQWVFRVAGTVMRSGPGDSTALRALKECYRKAILQAQSIESSAGDWQASGLMFMLLVCGFLLVFFFAA